MAPGPREVINHERSAFQTAHTGISLLFVVLVRSLVLRFEVTRSIRAVFLLLVAAGLILPRGNTADLTRLTSSDPSGGRRQATSRSLTSAGCLRCTRNGCLRRVGAAGSGKFASTRVTHSG
jgi:hypothetical protein